MNTNQLNKFLKMAPDTIQFAKDRKFEEAWQIKLSNPRPNQEIINEYINKEPFEILIVEYIWNWNIDAERFVLTVFFDKTCVLKDPVKFITISLDSFYNYKGISELINSINDNIIGRKHLFNCPLEAVNLGIFNYWLASKPIDLWVKGEEYNPENVRAKLLSRPDLLSTTQNFQGLQFRFNISGNYSGPYFGFKTPCCNKKDNRWELDINTINYWLNYFINTEHE